MSASYFPVSGGDLSGSAPGNLNLAPTGISAGVYSDTALTIDAKGRALVANTFATTATSGGTTALTVASAYQQQFTGTLPQTITLPDTSTLSTGRTFLVSNLSSALLTVQTFSSVVIMQIPVNEARVFTCISTASNIATAWKYAVNVTAAAQNPVAPAIQSVAAATYTQLVTDYTMIFSATCTLTLLPPASAVGRIIYLSNIAAVAVTSASANVVPIASATPGTAILTAVAGKWAMLQSDGISWVTMAAN